MGVPLRKNVQFQLLWFGGAVSLLGTQLTTYAMLFTDLRTDSAERKLALSGDPGQNVHDTASERGGSERHVDTLRTADGPFAPKRETRG